MTEQVKTPIAIESGHWYDKITGEPRYTIIGKNGKERATTLRDAKANGYVPSVTTIIREAAKPALDIWKQKQVMLAALTLPRNEGELDADFCDRILADSKEQAKQAAERGSALHGAIELRCQGKCIESQWWPHVDAVAKELSKIGIDLAHGKSEHSFAHPIGFGGKVDAHCDDWIVDFKSKEKIEDGKEYAYDEQLMQLTAYQYGLKLPAPRLVNVFVGVTDAKVIVHEWPAEEYLRAWRMFESLLKYWQIKSRLLA